MKKLYLTMLALFFTTTVFSQVIVNEGFEAGNTDGQPPVGWTCDSDGWRCGHFEQDHNRIPHSGDWYVYAFYNRDKWMYKQISVEANSIYRVAFWYTTNGVGHFNLEIKAGNAANPSAMTTTIMPSTVINNDTYQYATYTFTNTTAGTLFIGFHYVADNLTWYLSLDDIVIEKTNPYNFAVTQLTPDTLTYFGEFGYFRFNIENIGSEMENVTMDNVSGGFQDVALMENGTATTNVTVPVGQSKNVAVRAKVPMNSTPNQNMTLNFDIVSTHNSHSESLSYHCTALAPVSQFPLTEGFDGTFPPTGWQNVATNGTDVFEQYSVGEWPMCNPHNESAAMARYNSYHAQAGYTCSMITPKLQLSTTGNTVRYWIFRNFNNNINRPDKINVYYSPTTNTADGTLLGSVHRNTMMEPVVGENSDWYEYSYTFDCPEGFGFVIFEAESGYGWNLFIDDIFINTTNIDNNPPTIVFLNGTQTWADSEMELTVRIYDESGLPNEMGATYTIDGQSYNVTFNKVGRANRDFVATLPAQANHTTGSIVFHLVDELGNAADSDPYNLHWDWQAPLLLEGFEGELFPPEGWLCESLGQSWFTWFRRGAMTTTDWWGNEYYVQPPQGTKQAALEWDDSEEWGPQDEKLITPILSIERPTALTFETFCQYGVSQYQDHYQVDVLNTSTGSWSTLWDAVEQTEYVNQYHDPVNIDLSDFQGQNIRLRFRGYNADNDVLAYSWCIDKVKVVATDTIPDMVNENRLETSLFPNPAHNSLTIMAEKEIQHINIYNILSVKVMEIAINNKEAVIDLSKLDEGMYMIEIVGKNEKSTKRFIKK